jgi:hypothetical protein
MHPLPFDGVDCIMQRKKEGCCGISVPICVIHMKFFHDVFQSPIFWIYPGKALRYSTVSGEPRCECTAEPRCDENFWRLVESVKKRVEKLVEAIK